MSQPGSQDPLQAVGDARRSRLALFGNSLSPALLLAEVGKARRARGGQEQAEGSAPLQASASGGQLQAGQERARKGLVPLLFSQNKGNSLALLEVACLGCASLLSSDNLATWELPCSSPAEPALRDANSFRMSCPLQRSVFRFPGWGGQRWGHMMALAGPRLTVCHMPGRRSAPAGANEWGEQRKWKDSKCLGMAQVLPSPVQHGRSFGTLLCFDLSHANSLRAPWPGFAVEQDGQCERKNPCKLPRKAVQHQDSLLSLLPGSCLGGDAVMPRCLRDFGGMGGHSGVHLSPSLWAHVWESIFLTELCMGTCRATAVSPSCAQGSQLIPKQPLSPAPCYNGSVQHNDDLRQPPSLAQVPVSGQVGQY